MHPYLIQFELASGTLVSLPSFGAMVLFSIILAAAFSLRRLQRLGIDFISGVAVLCFAVALGFLGAALTGGFFSQFDHVRSAGCSMEDFTLVWQGGVIVGLIGAVGMLRYLEHPILAALDLVIPALFLGLAVGRLGCLMGGCCFGAPTEQPWGLVYPATHVSRALYGAQPLHPTPLYSAILAILLFLGGGLLPKGPKPGVVFFGSLLVYSVGRLGIEVFRGDHGAAVGVFTVQQLLSGLLVLLLALALAWRFRVVLPLPEQSQKANHE